MPQSMTLSHNMSLLHLTEQSYRTDRLTGVFALPLRQETAAQYAILPNLLTRSCADYPTLAGFNRRLDELYGATVQGEVFRLGGWQLLTFSISYLNRRYTLDGSDLTTPCVNLLLDMLFNPALVDGAFPADVFAQEQRCLLERLQGEMNNKRMYARQRCEELLCPDHPFSCNPNGTEETVSALTPAMAEEARRQMLATANIHWLYQSADDTDALIRELDGRFATLGERTVDTTAASTDFAIKESERTEKMQVSQAKLVLGFRIDVTEPIGDIFAAQLMNTLWGGCATSLLFTHVREEKSLCYYCASTYDRFAGIILVDSGIQTKDADAAREEILRQLDALCAGNFSDEELEAARRCLIQKYVSACDNADALENFYIGQTLYDVYLTPEQKRAKALEVTREDVCRAAQMVRFDSLYMLVPNDEEVAE